MAKKLPLPSVSRLREFSVPLIAGVVFALAWANLWPQSYLALIHTPLLRQFTFEFFVNEVFMTFFFGIAAVEITDSLVAGGSLNPLPKAVTPLIAMAGGVLGPIIVFLGLNAAFGHPDFTRGWGIGTATDIALAWLVARLVFGDGHPAISFLLLLAIGDDAVGLAIIAIFYPDPIHPVRFEPLLLVAVGMAIAYSLRTARTRSYWPYLILGGIPAWLGLYQAHLHPALALVFIVPFMPHRRRPADQTVFEISEREHSTLSTFETEWKVIVDLGLLSFGLANAGVRFAAIGTVTWLVFVSLLVGKTIGIFGFGIAARSLGFPLPAGMSRRELFLTAMVAAIGLTVALFVAGAAFPEGPIRAAAKMGALASALVAPLVLVLRGMLRPQRHPAASQATPPD